MVTLVIAMVLYLYFRQDSSACGAMPRRDHPTPDPRIVCCPPLLLYMTAYGATYYRTVLFYPHVPIHKTTENPEPYRVSGLRAGVPRCCILADTPLLSPSRQATMGYLSVRFTRPRLTEKRCTVGSSSSGSARRRSRR